MLFFFNDTATTEIYTLSLHDALPIYRLLLRHRRLRVHSLLRGRVPRKVPGPHDGAARVRGERLHRTRYPDLYLPPTPPEDRKSTRLNSSHANISYAVFCLKKKMKQQQRGVGKKGEMEEIGTVVSVDVQGVWGNERKA